MDNLLEMILDVILEVIGDSEAANSIFLNSSLYPLLPQKERSESMESFLRFVCYLPALIALLAMLSPFFYIICSRDSSFLPSAFIGCCIAAVIGLVYLAAVVIVNLILDKKRK